MQLRAQQQDGYVLVGIDAEHLGTAAMPAFRRELESCLTNANRVVVDMKAVRTTDSAGLGALVSLHRMTQKDAEILLVGPSEALRHSVQRAGLADLFPCFQTLDAAVLHTRQLLNLHQSVGASAKAEDSFRDADVPAEHWAKA